MAQAAIVQTALEETGALAAHSRSTYQLSRKLTGYYNLYKLRAYSVTGYYNLYKLREYSVTYC